MKNETSANVPTTGEIVGDLQIYLLVSNMEKPTQLVLTIKKAADRLELLERENERLMVACETALGTIAALTARAEQAEAREKAAIADMEGYCQFCEGYQCEENEPPCNTCFNARTFEPDDVERTKNWKYRGLPQDGEGK